MPPPADDKVFASGEGRGATGTTTTTTTTATTTAATTTTATEKSVNILDDLLDLTVPSTTATATTTATSSDLAPSSTSASSGDVLADLFGPSSSPSVPATSTAVPSKEVSIYKKNDVVAVLQVTHPNNNPHFYSATAKITGATPNISVSDVLLRVAVPKWLKLELEPASGNILSPTVQSITQLIKIIDTSNGSNPVMLRIRFTFKNALGQTIDDMVEFTIPATI